jgi:PAS domain S-box-containing protein
MCGFSGATTGGQHQYREALLELTTDEDIISGNVDASIQTITELAATVLDVPRVNIWLFNEDKTLLRCIDQFDQRIKSHSNGQELSASAGPAYTKALQSSRIIDATDVYSDSRTAQLYEQYFNSHNIGALLDATIRSEGDVIGVICHEHIGGPRQWTDKEIQFAGDIADVIHRAFRNWESRHQRQQLQFRQSLLNAQHETVPYGVIVISNTGEVLSYNDRFRNFWGLSDNALDREITKSPFEQILPQLASPEALADRIDQFQNHPHQVGDGELTLSDGRDVEWYSAPVVGDDDEYFGRLWVTRDITERKERQRELERKNRAIETAPIGITLSDPAQPDNPLTYVNKRFTDLTGHAETDVLGRNCRFLQGEQTAPEPVAEIRAAIDAERPVTVELQNYRKDGTPFWNRVTIAPVYDEEGALSNYVGFQQDVTDRKEATRQLRVLHRVLRHNLSNQLTVIRGYADSLAESETEIVPAAVEGIQNEIDQLEVLIKKHRKIVGLLDEAPEPRTYTVEEIVTPAVSTVRNDHPDADIQIDICKEQVEAIPVIDIAIEELLLNAVVHTDSHPSRVQISSERRNGFVEISIADNGPGLPAEEIAILLGTQEVEPLKHGKGLGLWLVYLIVFLSGGMINVEDSEGEGTVICIKLPRIEASSSALD